jgi:hypothetical protein
MSDFLSNLASRSLNNSNVVRPRLSSLFEPQNHIFIRPPNENFELEHFVEDAKEEAAPKKRPNASSETPNTGAKHSGWDLSQAPRHENEIGPEDAVKNVFRPHRELKAPEPASEESSTARQSRSSHQQSASARAAEAELFSQKNEPRSPKLKPDFKEDMPERNASFDGVRQHLKVMGSLPEMARQKAIEFASLRPRSEPISAGASRGQQQLLQPAAQASSSEIVSINPFPLHPPATRYSGPAALRQNGPLDMPEPTIEVTIGRIEVRATPSVSQPRAQSQSQRMPKTSLDEYLHQRSKGGIK